MTRVSIIIPCFNDGKYLPEAVASAQAQTHPDVEIIVVDDHSTDPLTLRVYDDLRRRGLTVLQTPQGRKGPSAARNAGIAAASGDYILPLDADDKMDASYVGKAAAILDAEPSTGICYCRARFFGLRNGPWELPPYAFDALLCGNMIFATALFRKSDWGKAGGYNEALTEGLEDYAFWLRLTDSGAEVRRLEEELFFYRVKSYSRTAQLASDEAHSSVLAMVYASCEDIFARHAGVLLQKIAALQNEQARRVCLFSWRLCAPLFRLEWRLRQSVKKIVGRC